MKKKVYIVFGAILLAALGLFFFFLPGYVGRRMNATIEGPPYAASERAKALQAVLAEAEHWVRPRIALRSTLPPCSCCNRRERKDD